MTSPGLRSARAGAPRPPILVGVAGGSGSGKTWLAEKLEQALSPRLLRISLDDFYRDRSHLPEGRRSRVNFDHPRAIDWIELERTLKRLLRGQNAIAPCYDFKTHSRLAEGRKLHPKPLILVEGLWVLRRASMRRLFSLSVFVDCDSKTRLRRRLARDLQSRGRTSQSVRAQFLGCVEPMHRQYVRPQKEFADLVLAGGWGAPEVRRVAGAIKRLCFSGAKGAPKTPH